MEPQGRLLLVDDEPPILRALTPALSAAGYAVETAETGEAALTLMAGEPCDVVILDLGLPDMDGKEVIRRVREWSEAPIIVLSARDLEAEKIAALDLGADDFVNKPVGVGELLARIRAVMRRAREDEEDGSVVAGALRIDGAAHRVFARVGAEDAQVPIGPTEYRLLHFFMTHPERVYSRAQLLDHVWGGSVYVEERTVDVHIRRLRRTLEPAGLDAMVQTVRGAGYRFSATT
jgi:two-component system phosphate regulon response regulator PhoB